MGLLNKREKQAMEVMQERNKIYLDSYDDANTQAPVTDNEIYPEGTFEKGDLPAIIISALIVFSPIILVLGLLALLAFKVLLSA